MRGAWWCWWGVQDELCRGYIGVARVELGNMADCDGHMIDWSSFVVQIYKMQIQVSDVKFVLLHVHNGQVLR